MPKTLPSVSFSPRVLTGEKSGHQVWISWWVAAAVTVENVAAAAAVDVAAVLANVAVSVVVAVVVVVAAPRDYPQQWP